MSPWESNRVDNKPRVNDTKSVIVGIHMDHMKNLPSQCDNKKQQGLADNAGEVSMRIPGVNGKNEYQMVLQSGSAYLSSQE
jgi:hypothetical protein